MTNQVSATSTISFSLLPAIAWQDWATCSYSDEVAVFRSELPNLLAIKEEPAELQVHEISRAQRFRREEDRHRFIHARRVLRVLLGKYVNQQPVDVQFASGANRKPVLADSTDWHFNVSHSGKWILVAIGKESVGIDLEKITPGFVFQDIVSQSFSEQEQQYIENSRDPRQAFYQLWTRKEALVKATAKGIDDDFSIIPSLEGIHTVSRALIGVSGNWLVNSFWVDDGYPAAVAYPETIGRPQFYDLNKL